MKFCFWGNISGALLGNNPGGGELQVALLAKALALKGHEVVIIDPYSNKSFVTTEGVNLVHIPEWNRGIKGFRLFWNRIPALWKILLKQKADYYYVRMRSFMHLIPYWVAKKNKSKFIVGIASDIDVMGFRKKFKYSYKNNYNILRILFVNVPNDIVFRYLLKKSDYVMLQHSGQHFGNSILRKHQFIFRNIIKTDFTHWGGNESKRYYLYVGSLTMLKGADNLLNLVNNVENLTPFKIVGLPRGKKPEKIFQELGNKKNVELEGWKSHDETLSLISGAKALINTSYYEGFSNAFLEAWSLGVPVISLNVNPGEIINNYGLGICCNGDIKEMRQIIESNSVESFDKNVMISYVSKFHSFDTAANRFSEILNNAS